MATNSQTCDPNDITSLVCSNIIGNNGSYLTNVTNAASWTISSTAFHSNNNLVMSIPSNGNEVIVEPSAALNVKGTIVMNGEDLSKRLERIETLLNIPSRDVEMEKEFPKLKHLWEEYNLELEKYKTWKRLNSENRKN
jgi:hypothetical protein